MKLLKIIIGMFTILIFSSSMFAQKSSYFNGVYAQYYGDNGYQKMEIITNGGRFYTVHFSGDCNARTAEGSVRNGVLEIPIIGGNNDIIIIKWKGEKLDVAVTNEKVMRNSCGGSSIEGLYDRVNNNPHSSGYNDNYNHKKYTKNNFNNSYYSRDSRSYNSHADVHDLMKISATIAYEKLQERGFHLVKTTKGKSKMYKVWYNNETNQCIKTISINKHIHDVLRSTHCN